MIDSLHEHPYIPHADRPAVLRDGQMAALRQEQAR